MTNISETVTQARNAFIRSEASNPCLSTIIAFPTSFQQCIREQNLTDALELLEQHELTGETALFVLGIANQAYISWRTQRSGGRQ